MLFELGKLRSIYARMFLVICAAAIPTSIGLGIYVFQQRAYLSDLSLKNAQTYVDLAAQEQLGLFSSTRKTLAAIATMPDIKAGNWVTCQEYLSNLLKVQPTYADIGVISVSGESLCSGSVKPGANRPDLGDRSYFWRALHEPGLSIGNYQIGRFTRSPTLVVATALHDQNNEVSGILYAGLRLSAFSTTEQRALLDSDATLMVLDRHGVILNSSAKAYAAGQKISDPDILSLINSTDRNSTTITDQNGTKSFISHTRAGPPEDPRSLTVVYQYPTESSMQNINNGFWISGAITILLVLIALALGWAGTQALVGRNIRHLMEGTKRLRQRDFNTRLSDQMTGLEFTQIAQQLDQMTEEIDTREHQWERLAQRQQGQSKILKLIAQNHPTQDTLRALLLFIQDQTDNSFASIIMLDADGEQVGTCLAPDLPAGYQEAVLKAPVGPQTGPCGLAIRENRTVIHTDIAVDAAWAPYQRLALDHGLHACWAMPIRSHDNTVLGSFALHYTEPHSPSPDELHLGQMAAELAAIAVEHRRQSDALDYQSHHDTLTGLLNRSVFTSRVTRRINEVKKRGGIFYIAILNLDNFKEVNDALGHQFGDLLLQQVGERLQNLFGEPSTVARTGGDEFAILIQDDQAAKSIDSTIEEAHRSIKQPFLLDGIQIQASGSIGAAQYPRDGTQTSLLLRRAETAMQSAKSEGVGYAVYDWKKDLQTPNQLMLMSNLRQALKEQQFILHYQPKITLENKKVVGFEALIRWQNPIRGLLYPSEFMSVIELSELIHPLSLWVIQTAVEQCKAWHENGHKVTIAVNVSTRNLLDISLPEKIRDILAQHQLDPQWLELEITESSIMADPARSLSVLTKIHEIGISIAIDDFGTGYSSLAYLQKLPVDNLKIDRSFVIKMNEEKETRSIVSSIIGLAHNLNLTVTAEGIEDHTVLTKLTELGCDCAQGYYVGKPMPRDQVDRWLKKSAWSN